MEDFFKATVLRVLDGDSFVIKENYNNMNVVRLSGVSVPSRGSKNYLMPKKELEDRILNKDVYIKKMGTSYGRIVAKVEVNKKNINQEMKEFNVEKKFKITNKSTTFIKDIIKEDRKLLEKLAKM